MTLESSAYRNPVGGHRAIANVPWEFGKEAKSPNAVRKWPVLAGHRIFPSGLLALAGDD
jgi:hypothetical protein